MEKHAHMHVNAPAHWYRHWADLHKVNTVVWTGICPAVDSRRLLVFLSRLSNMHLAMFWKYYLLLLRIWPQTDLLAANLSGCFSCSFNATQGHHAYGGRRSPDHLLVVISSNSFFSVHPTELFIFPTTLPGFFAHCLNSVFLSAFLSNSFVSFMHFLSASVPEVLMSCPAIEGRRGMLILSAQRHGAGEGEKGGGNVTRLRKLDGHCSVCVCVCVRMCMCMHLKRSVWLTFPVFPIFTLLPCRLNYICVCVCRCAFVGADGKF